MTFSRAYSPRSEVNLEPSLALRVRTWIDDDPDPLTRAELEATLADAQSGDVTAAGHLESAFNGTLQFGTAGLRGQMGGGPHRMNSAVVRRASAGLAAHVVATNGRTAVIGYDARHQSEQFARDTAAVMSAAGLEVFVLPEPLPTPVLAYAVRSLSADVGVMITASHNPALDNGYKVYLAGGSQLAPPTDAAIATLIDAVGPVRAIPVGDRWVTLGDELLNDYLTDAANVVAAASPRTLSIVHTAMHGVGTRTFTEALARAGFDPANEVVEQRDPDPDFPTVAFPNPEETGAMDLALAMAARCNADVVIAHDPDADRCAVGIASNEAHRMLSGDDVGSLLAWWAIDRARRGWAPVPHGTFASSIVSSSLLASIAADAGLRHQETLTGFKWIGAIPDLAYGYEEALGYCVDPEHVRDKDGISAALRVAEMVATLKAESSTVDDVLDELARTHGVHATSQLSLRFADVSEVAPLIASLRENPPSQLGSLPITDVADLAVGYGGLAPTEGLRYSLGNSGRVIVRPSGTEPKLKCYLEVVVPVSESDVNVARTQADVLLKAIRDDLFSRLQA